MAVVEKEGRYEILSPSAALAGLTPAWLLASLEQGGKGTRLLPLASPPTQRGSKKKERTCRAPLSATANERPRAVFIIDGSRMRHFGRARRSLKLRPPDQTPNNANHLYNTQKDRTPYQIVRQCHTHCQVAIHTIPKSSLHRE